ncbi:hypothetical protein Tco_0711116 [Tanacetum coccineum]
MVAYLEKTDGNTEFHQIMDFLTHSSISYALTSRTVNNISYIDATVAGKPVTISEASIRSDLLFDDADGIDSLNNQAIFDNIQLMGYEGDLNTLTFNKALFSPQWKFLFHTMNHCISSKSTSWDQIPTNIATAVICLVTNQKYNFSKLIFGGMIRHLDATKKFVMYPRFLQIFLSNQLKDVPVPLDHFPVLTLTKKVLTFMVKKGKNFSGKVTPLFDSMLIQQTEDEGDASERPSDSPPIPSPPHPSEDQPQIQPKPSPKPSPITHIPDSIPEGSGGNHEGQSSNDASLSGNEDCLTLQSVYDLCASLCKQVKAQAKEIKALKAQVKKLKRGVKPLITHHKAWMKTRLARKTSLKKKGVHKEYVSKQGRKSVKTFKGEPSVHKDPAFDDLNDFVDVDDTLDYMETEDVQDERRNEGTDKGNEGKSATQTAPTPTSTPTPTTPTLTVFGNDKAIAQVLIIMSQNKEKLKEKENGVEIRNIEETKRTRPTSTRSILTLRPLPKIDLKDKGKKRIKEEDESDTESEGITEAEKKFKQLANDEEVAKKARLNADKILAEKLQEEERDVLYERLKRQDQNYVVIGSAKDERQTKELNKDPEKKRLKKRVVNETPRKEDTAKVPAEQEVTEKGTKKRKSGHVKMIARKRPRPQLDDDSDDEHRKCLRMVTFKGTIYSEIMETKSFIARLHRVSSPDGNYLVVYRVNGHFRAFNYLIEGDLKIMMESLTEENDQELKDGTVIYMLVERRYPLSKELLQQMIDLGLEVEEESIVALQLGSQLTLLHSKELASLGSNSSWLSIHLVVYNKELAIPEQTATGKGISNPLMIAEDVKIIKDQDQDLSECLDTSSKSSRHLN